MNNDKINIDREIDKILNYQPIELNTSFEDEIFQKISIRQKSKSNIKINISLVAIIAIINVLSIYSFIDRIENRDDTRYLKIRTLVNIFSLND